MKISFESTSTPIIRPEINDEEMGYHRFLSVESVEASLEGKVVTVIDRKKIWSSMLEWEFIFCFFSLLSSVFGWLLILACPESEEADGDEDPFLPCFASLFIGGPLLVFCTLFSLASFFVCGVSGRKFYKMKKSLQYNQKLSEIISNLTYVDTKDEPLTAHDFIKLVKDEVLDNSLLQHLSFDQIRKIRAACQKLDQLNPVEKEGEKVNDLIVRHWNHCQQAPWRKLEMIPGASCRDLSDLLSDEYVVGLIEDTPGFLEELVLKLLEVFFAKTDYQKVILDNIRHSLIKRFSYDFSDVEIVNALANIATGGEFEKCLRMQRTQEGVIQISCGKLFEEIPRSVLSESSEYFRAQFRFNKEIDQFDLEDFPPKLFQVFVDFLQGKKVTVYEENVEDYLHLAQFFGVPALSEMCQTPLVQKYRDADIETKLELLERYPNISGRFRDHVDETLAKQYTLGDLTSQARDIYRFKRLGLHRSVKALNILILNYVEEWIESESSKVELLEFIKQIEHFHTLFPFHEKLTQKLIDVAQSRFLSHESEILEVYTIMQTKPSFLMVEALNQFVHSEKHKHLVQLTFISVKSVKETLKNLKTQFAADRDLMNSIKNWEALDMMRSSFDEFIAQVLEYRSLIQTDALRVVIEDRLIDIIRSRISNDDTLSESDLEFKARENPFLERAVV